MDGWTDGQTGAEKKTRYLNLTYIAIKFHNDIPTGNLVMEYTRIASRFFSKGNNLAKNHWSKSFK